MKKTPPRMKVVDVLYAFYGKIIIQMEYGETLIFDSPPYDLIHDGSYNSVETEHDYEESISIKKYWSVFEKIYNEHKDQYEDIRIVEDCYDNHREYRRIVGVRLENDKEYTLRLEKLKLKATAAKEAKEAKKKRVLECKKKLLEQLRKELKPN